MISYAQNAEDVVLARALPWARGFYVDVGAADPVIASVTKHFYDHGWRGINIDPRPAAIKALREMRPEDINLEVAAGDGEGSIELFVCVEDPDLSTTSESDRAFLIEKGFHFQTRAVALCRLDDILESHDVTSVDFLKIDVEGSEGQVLAGLDLVKWHPRVIVVEAVRPWSSIRSDAEWNSILVESGYSEGCFDGINRFFARSDDSEVLERLVPASALDDFQTAAVHALETEIDTVRTYVRNLEAHIGHLEGSTSGFGQFGPDLETELETVRAYARRLEAHVRILEGSADGSHEIAPKRPAPVVPDSRDVESSWVSTRTRLSRGQGMAGKLGSPPRPDPRFAVLGTGQSGDVWISRMLAELFDSKESYVGHPADVDWNGLPRRLVLRMNWPRSVLLADMLHRRSFCVVSPARHPFDTLAALWETTRVPMSRDGRESESNCSSFVEWALSDDVKRQLMMTTSWWSVPSTCRIRFEDLEEEGPTYVWRVLTDHGYVASVDPSTVTIDSQATFGQQVSQPLTAHGWKNLISPVDLPMLKESYSRVFSALGYDLP